MLYATLQDIVDRYGEDILYILFDRDNAGVIDDVAVDRALADASDEIDSYLAQNTKLPLTTVPTVLNRVCVELALYHGSTEMTMTEERRQRYKDQVSWLTKVANGTVSLGLPAESEAVEKNDIHVDSADKEFSRETLEKF